MKAYCGLKLDDAEKGRMTFDFQHTALYKYLGVLLTLVFCKYLFQTKFAYFITSRLFANIILTNIVHEY